MRCFDIPTALTISRTFVRISSNIIWCIYLMVSDVTAFFWTSYLWIVWDTTINSVTHFLTVKIKGAKSPYTFQIQEWPSVAFKTAFTKNFITARLSVFFISNFKCTSTHLNVSLQLTDGWNCFLFHTGATDSCANMRKKSFN